MRTLLLVSPLAALAVSASQYSLEPSIPRMAPHLLELERGDDMDATDSVVVEPTPEPGPSEEEVDEAPEAPVTRPTPNPILDSSELDDASDIDIVAERDERTPISKDEWVKPKQVHRTGVKFDETWLEDHCDFSEFEKPLFMDPKYKFSEDKAVDDPKWTPHTKCEREEGKITSADKYKETTGKNNDILVYDRNVESKHACAERCWMMATRPENVGKVVCCEYKADAKECEKRLGWQTQEKSDFAHGVKGLWRTPKESRLMFASSEEAADVNDVPRLQSKEYQSAEEAKGHVRDLVEQINHMSIDGMLDHMLSFYICMRWIPDWEFVKVTMFEMENVSVNQTTRATPGMTREKIIEEYFKMNLIPLRCGTAMHVQEIASIDWNLEYLSNFHSPLSEMYRYVTTANKIGTGFFKGDKDKLKEIDEHLGFKNADDNRAGDTDVILDARKKIREILPWSTFIRPSNNHADKHHIFQPDNNVMVCFGPRVASYPHKRQGGEVFLADQNMAGCNGFWNEKTTIDQLELIKDLFRPERCFEYQLRKELKEQFMKTFVNMNTAFEGSMKGEFQQYFHPLDPLANDTLHILNEKATEVVDVDAKKEAYVEKKYKHFAPLVAGAHSKWLICKAKDTVPEEAFGNADNFFRNPRAYEKWLGKLSPETEPECKTLDDATGCVKCVVAVKDEHGCHVRLNVTRTDLFHSIKERKYPFLQSDYKVPEVKVDEKGRKKTTLVKKTGTCMARKTAAAIESALEDGGEEQLRESFFQLSNNHVVYQVDPPASAEASTRASYRYNVGLRKKTFAKWLESGGKQSKSELDAQEKKMVKLLYHMASEKIEDQEEMFAKKFIYTDSVPALSNRPALKVDYFVSCPCDVGDFTPHLHFQNVGSQGMAEYYNA